MVSSASIWLLLIVLTAFSIDSLHILEYPFSSEPPPDIQHESSSLEPIGYLIKVDVSPIHSQNFDGHTESPKTYENFPILERSMSPTCESPFQSPFLSCSLFCLLSLLTLIYVYKKFLQQKTSDLSIENKTQKQNSFVVETTPENEINILATPENFYLSQTLSELEVPFEPLESQTSELEEGFESLASVLNNGNYNRQFTDISKLGQGGFGSVEKARHRLDGQYYAIKKENMKLHPHEAIENHYLLNEVKALLTLQSKYVVKYNTCWAENSENFGESESEISSVESEEEETQVYKSVKLHIEMEYCGGLTLENWLEKTEKKGDMEKNLKILYEILKGIKHIHSKGIIHRDLKPSNIFMNEEEKIKIGDFNLATCRDEQVKKSNVGTPIYMAPEELNSSDYDEKVDMYPVGLIIVEMFSEFDTQHERILKLTEAKKGVFDEELEEKYPEVSELAKELLEGDPKQRPAAQDVLNWRVFKFME